MDSFPLVTVAYNQQLENWPQAGRCILAQYDEEGIFVYQAYNPRIGRFAASNGYFGGEFSLNRMTWIKTNFLWMMYRSGWGTKANQEVTLAIKLRRHAFEEILSAAVPASFDASRYETREEWSADIRQSETRLQWDPDHDPLGNKVERRAIQLGLRGEMVKRYSKDWVLSISDISEFVIEQRKHVESGHLNLLRTPAESEFTPASRVVCNQLGVA